MSLHGGVSAVVGRAPLAYREIMQLASRTYEAADVGAVQELYHSNGWTDGLPIVPPTEEAVRACLDWAMMPPDQLIGVEPVRGLAITAEKLAINAVMAGCRPMQIGRAHV